MQNVGSDRGRLSRTAMRVSYRQFRLTLYLIETPINAFANKTDPEQAALPDQGLLYTCVCLIQH